MDVETAIRTRTSVKKFKQAPVEVATIRELLELAVLAPNHRMTEPWGFLVLGDDAKLVYARVLARRKSKNTTDPEAQRMIREKVERQTMEVPAMIVFTVDRAEDPEIREEDLSATWMAVENVCLAALGRGLGTHIKTGAVLEDPELREAWSIADDRRVVALLHLGEPDGEPRITERTPARERTRWLD